LDDKKKFLDDKKKFLDDKNGNSPYLFSAW
jgi:hypothetical protein